MTGHDRLYIGGEWVAPAGTGTLTVVSPSTEEVLGAVPEGTEADVDRAVDAARTAFDDPQGWSTWTPQARAEVLERFAVALDASAAATAQAVSSQNGMPIRIAQALESVFPALLLRYYGTLVANRGTEERRDAMFGGTTIVRREPVGVVAAIVPWNFPQALAFVKIAPALAAGCTVVVKPAPETVLDSWVMAEAAQAAGLPPGVLSIVPAGREVGAHLVAHPGVDKVAFTGSSAAGRAIAETCGRLLRPVTLELGGKSAAIVLDDADLTAHSEALFGATLLNNGQTCFLGTRVLAPRSRYAEIVEQVSALASGLVIGDALDPATQIGPLVSARQRDRVETYIAKGLADGARVTAGGGRPADRDRGFFVSPTVFADVDNNHTIAQEEIFGPVLAVIPYTDTDDAVRIANDSDYGLGGSVWSSDPERATAVARRVRTGSIGINSYVNDPVSPFGGVKASGLGREMGPEGLAGYEVLTSIYAAP
ncbi:MULTISPECIES: aldehyde dehydrogenase [Pseudonocardia]|uniref:Geranial dehydrogenase n=2 Tax=Pseudonocardia TaxID=1847 RepID=A0A1Y2N001_PSEAH|nr:MULTISPECIES: aldehyde dehydrogenase [Pseudonocardia]OSY40750.1 Geranial dehydrogenase [Pseudonocardia autotrophica]TDN71943.1 acyl-CoA reductase-like NAD-dependent aldehyde dehydrogenase [Pseudonocardia autotrophica]BBG02630.1 aldehyde dehydrogenase [Pseudonocardia autotrophica]GEC24689.1 aldehyde dehydrogenase [Pseudonocardia saturnea]